MYPKKIITPLLHKHAQMFVPYTSECEDQLDCRCKSKPWGVATIYFDPLFENHKKIKELEKGWL